ncbi:alpha-ketoacid dehydrogenase kinase [Neoconidiobolus thromboides FSU 785]|nr:alpha-ketoacid dehydrogenase kinase [Neoconidiobolus thromboides FSU 785]
MFTKIPQQLYRDITHFSKFPQTGVSLSQMVKFGHHPSIGTLLKASQFVSEELPVRLAHRVVELDNLPDGLSDMPSVQKVKHWYAESFEDIIKFNKALPANLKNVFRTVNTQDSNLLQLPTSKRNPDIPASYRSNGSVSLHHRYYTPIEKEDLPSEVVKSNDQFVALMEKIKRRHDPVVTTLLKELWNINQLKNIQSFLDRFYMSRIGIRMLLGQHIALHREEKKEDYVGIICTKTSISQIAQEAIDNASFICEDYYGLFKAPRIILHCPDDLEFMYVPSHLHHVLFELLKNSLRAVVDRFGDDCDDEYPPIKIIVAKGNEDITIKISDEGGGIPRSVLPMVWTYMYTTAETPQLDPDFNKTDFKAPMAGFGYGLPLSRLYARYFGGDIKIISMEGYGTDAYIHLSRLSDSEEPLP